MKTYASLLCFPALSVYADAQGYSIVDRGPHHRGAAQNELTFSDACTAFNISVQFVLQREANDQRNGCRCAGLA